MTLLCDTLYGNLPGRTEPVSCLKSSLTDERYRHSLRTALFSEFLCSRYGVDEDSGYRAGLLHDIAREHGDRRIVELASRDGLPISRQEYEIPILLHGRAGAQLLREQFGIEDPQILDAVRWHTVGRPGMSVLEKVVFCADYIEPGRRHITPEFRQRLIARSLDEMVLEILRDMFAYMAGKGIEPAANSLALYEEIASRVPDHETTEKL